MKDVDKAATILEAYLEKSPRDTKPLRLIIDLLPAKHPKFRASLVKYLRPQVIKGVPSLINDIKVFYRTDSDKAAIIGELLQQMSDSMEKRMHLDAADEDEQDPTV